MSGYGISQQTKIESGLDAAAEAVRRLGFAVVENYVSPEELTVLRERLEPCYQTQVRECGGDAALAAINDANVLRLPLAYDPAYLDLAASPRIREIAERLLGQNFVLIMQNGLLNQAAEAHQQAKWHRDLNYQHWVISRPIAISILVCLDDFRVDNGATFVLSGSHLVEEFPSDPFVAAQEIQITAKAGSAIVMDAMVFHRAGTNRSNAVRRAVNHVIGAPFMAQQISIPAVLGDRFGDTPFLFNYLGYRWQPQPSPLAWRQQKMPKQ